MHEAGNSTSPTFLSGTSGSQELSGLEGSKHSHLTSDGPRPVGGAGLVVRTRPAMERLLPEPTQTSAVDDPNGCVQDGFGCSLLREIHRRPPWSLQETEYHINYLELLAVFLAPQTFAKDLCLGTDRQRSDHGLYQSERQNTLLSPDSASQTTWAWCMQRKILLQAEHIAGSVNTQADKESRVIVDRWDSKLHPQIFYRLNCLLGPFQIDLFASRVSSQLRRFYSWRPDPLVEGTDAFLQVWTETAFANHHGL